MFEDYLQRLHQAHAKIIAQKLPADQALWEIISVLFTFTKKNERFFRLFWSLDSEEFNGDIPQELIHRIKLWNRALIDQTVGLIEKSQKKGLFHPCDPEILIHTISAFNKGIFIHTNKQNRLNIANVDPDALHNLFMELIANWLLPERQKNQNLLSSER
jgi:hypothetical protein